MDKKLGRKIYQIRRDKKLSVSSLAVSANISEYHWRQIERGGRMPSLNTFVNIVNSLGICANELLRDLVLTTDNTVDKEISTALADYSHEQLHSISYLLDASLKVLEQRKTDAEQSE